MKTKNNNIPLAKLDEFAKSDLSILTHLNLASDHSALFVYGTYF